MASEEHDYSEPSPRSFTPSQSQQTINLDTPVTAPPPEIESTLSRLSAYRNVRGVMVLSRASPSSSSLSHSTQPEVDGAQSLSTTAASSAGAVGGGIIQTTGSVFEGEGGRRYAKAVEGIVSNVSKAIGECEAGDELKFLRIRTKRHELIITPDDKYLLVVLQDPGQ
ncbi:hypothetical protein IAU59_000170 [Kwoniella sp. CBS 9459]